VTVEAAGGKLLIGNLLKAADLASSTSEAIRMIRQGAVRVDGERMDDTHREVPAGTTHVYQVGKRKFARVTVVAGG
jgi:tyrosyl-tRNA synthetase